MVFEVVADTLIIHLLFVIKIITIITKVTIMISNPLTFYKDKSHGTQKKMHMSGIISRHEVMAHVVLFFFFE